MPTIPIPRENAPFDGMHWHVMEACERAASLLLGIALFPLVLVSAAAVALLSGRTPLIAHRRVGWRGSTLWMIKLRTMWNGERREPGETGRTSGWVEYVDDAAGPSGKQEGDPRVTSGFARFCRRHSVDELPQLWHVIRGEMALVGPRPVTHAEMRRYYGADADEVLQVKPGIAGLWQISGRNRLSYRVRREMDLQFVRNRSLRMYMRIVLRTLPEVWRGANSW